MDIIKKYYKEDFKILVTLPEAYINEDFEITVMSGGRSYKAGYSEIKGYENCQIIDKKVLVAVGSHNLGCGLVETELIVRFRDTSMPGGIYKYANIKPAVCEHEGKKCVLVLHKGKSETVSTDEVTVDILADLIRGEKGGDYVITEKDYAAIAKIIWQGQGTYMYGLCQSEAYSVYKTVDIDNFIVEEDGLPKDGSVINVVFQKGNKQNTVYLSINHAAYLPVYRGSSQDMGTLSENSVVTLVFDKAYGVWRIGSGAGENVDATKIEFINFYTLKEIIKGTYDNDAYDLYKAFFGEGDKPLYLGKTLYMKWDKSYVELCYIENELNEPHFSFIWGSEYYEFSVKSMYDERARIRHISNGMTIVTKWENE